MYELFLTLRYLTRKAIVIFPILVVWLCVAMMIIVTGIMGGFVARVQQANRDLTGDIVIESRYKAGFPYYQELQDELGKLEEVEFSTPMIRAIGMLNTPRGNVFAQIFGVYPEQRARVTQFQKCLFLQYTAPMQAVEDLSRGGFPASSTQLQQRALAQVHERFAELERLERRLDKIDRGLPLGATAPNLAWFFVLIPVVLIEWLMIALTRDAPRWWRIVWWSFPGLALLLLATLALVPMIPHRPARADRERMQDRLHLAGMAHTRAQRTYEFARVLPPAQGFANRQELTAALVKPPAFQLSPIATNSGLAAPSKDLVDVIVGADMAFSRDRRGNYQRPLFGDAIQGVLIVAPVLRGDEPLFSANAPQQRVQIVDDSYTGVYDMDSTAVYVPFAIAQKMARMNEMEREEGGKTLARVSEILVKVRGGHDEAALQRAQEQISSAVNRVVDRHLGDFGIAGNMKVQTWDEKQRKYIGAVANEKNMLTVILLLMASVVGVVIFLIFYIIVKDKTRDIGIIKAVGGSEIGVANIFMFYGCVVGIFGGLLGAITGVAFVWHTNEIHEWLFTSFGIVIWDRSVYLFDRIPDQVNWWEVVLYFGLAVVAGWLGALIPALRAGLQNPVRSLRTE